MGFVGLLEMTGLPLFNLWNRSSFHGLESASKHHIELLPAFGLRKRVRIRIVPGFLRVSRFRSDPVLSERGNDAGQTVLIRYRRNEGGGDSAALR